MAKKDLFEFTYNGETYSVDKSSIKFSNGYGVIEKNVKLSVRTWGGYWTTEDATLRGVVDEEFNIVLDVKSNFTEIEIFPGGNIMVGQFYYGGDGEQTFIRLSYYHYQVIDGIPEMRNKVGIGEYSKIDDTTLRISNGSFKALYDLTTAELITPRFTKIGKFKWVPNSDNLYIAQCVLTITSSSDSQISYDIICYIDKSGALRSSIYVSQADSLIEVSDINAIEQIAETLRIKVVGESEKKNNLLRSLEQTIKTDKK